ncbi:MAG: helix-hairpin-helix domain-containing protein [Phycisphaerales bacterium]
MTPRRAMVLPVVIWCVAVAALITSATQLGCYRQAVMGREAMSKVQARWAARAGVETMIAIMEYYAEYPDPDSAFAMVNDLEDNAVDELSTGSFEIYHEVDGAIYPGPFDEHSRMNLNAVSKAQLYNMDDVGLLADAIVDWRDTNDDEEMSGAESRSYLGRSNINYQPRNANFRSVPELEMVLGVWPKEVRGEDWNLNNRLDPNENDGDASFPDDNADGVLDYGLAGLFTARTRPYPQTMAGEDRLDLKTASAEDIVARTGLSQQQATQLVDAAKQSSFYVEQLISTPLGQQAQQPTAPSSSRGRSGRSSAGRSQASVAQQSALLKPEQLDAVLRECVTQAPKPGEVGRVNINTVSKAVLERVYGLEPKVAQRIIDRRDTATGITTLGELARIDGLSPQDAALMARTMDTQSSVYTITSRGRAPGTGTEVEMIVVVDRSTLPVTILEYLEP